MNIAMRLSAFFLCLTVFSLACVSNESQPNVEAKLKTTMQNYLYNSVNNDSSTVHYQVESVVFFDDAKANVYICDFTVRMKVKSVDTTGNMRATISKDFKTVKRSS